MTIAYFDCFAGISGDMTIGALLDAGASADSLREQISTLGLSGYDLTADPVIRQGFRGTKASVNVQSHTHGHHDHHAHGRSLGDILRMIRESGLPERVQTRASRIFTTLGDAEARVHGKPASEVHFHEVGAIDSIVDIVGAAIGLELLGVDQLFCSPLPLGSGSVTCQHGVLPVPAPGTLELVRASGCPTWAGPGPGELVTPTGAAIVTALATFDRPPMRIHSTGYGFGDRDTPWPNAVRVWIGELEPPDSPSDAAERDTAVLLETNVDDSTPEVCGYMMERLLSAGALDVYFTPIFMKKNRPANMVSVLANPDDAERLVSIMMTESTTLGVRVTVTKRYKCHRIQRAIVTSLGEVRVKIKEHEGKPFDVSPEYDDCADIARRSGIPLQKVYATVKAEASKEILNH